MSKLALALLLLLLAGCPPRSETSAESAAQPSDTLAAALDEPDPFARLSRLGDLLPAMGPEALPEVRGAIREIGRDVPSPELVLLVRFVAMQDPAAAMDALQKDVSPVYRPLLIGPVVEEWAKRDPEAAIASVRAGMGSDPYSAISEIALVRSLFEQQSDDLLIYIQGLGQGFERQRAVRAYLDALIDRDGPPAAIHFAEAIPDGDRQYKIAVYWILGTELTRADPQAGAAWCAKHCDGPFGSGLADAVARAWAVQDGRAALEWAATLPEGTQREGAVHEAYRNWIRADRDGAMAWVAEQGPDGVPPWFQVALPTYAEYLSMRDPVAALPWLEQIAHEPTREYALMRNARRWRRVDEAAAEAWLAESPLSDELREMARKQGPLPGAARAAAAGRDAGAPGNGGESPEAPAPEPDAE